MYRWDGGIDPRKPSFSHFYPSILWGALFVCLACTPAWPQIDASLDSDSDGLIDLDEVSAQISISAGPSNNHVFEQASGYLVKPGLKLKIGAVGTIFGDVQAQLQSGPEGLEQKPSFPLVLDSAPHLSLIGRIGQGNWFAAGAARTIEASAEGMLSFAVNDVIGGFANNSGSFTVTLGKGLGTDPKKPDTDGDGYKEQPSQFQPPEPRPACRWFQQACSCSSGSSSPFPPPGLSRMEPFSNPPHPMGAPTSTPMGWC